jgi:hypothetical protein
MRGRKLKKDELVCGVGTIENMPDDWRRSSCPFFRKWKDMLTRCYDPDYQKKNPCYKGATVCEEWWDLRTFKQWMQKKDWKGKELDKDIRIPGNKEYGPDACMFVDRLFNHQKVRIDPQKPIPGKKYPQGVYLTERKNGPDKYYSHIMKDGKLKRLGTFPTVEAASSDYCKAKSEYLRELAEDPLCKEPILKEALLRWADIYENARLSV